MLSILSWEVISVLKITHETAIYLNPPIHSFTGDRKNMTSLIDHNLSMLCFCENIRRSNLLWTQHFDRRRVCNPTV